MSEISDHKSQPDECASRLNKESAQNIYSTRKKQIDFAKIGEKLSLTGSSCHYCKNTMTVQFSNACRNLDKNSKKKKNCNKKFCYDCLQKYFRVFWENKNDKGWKCPCCLKECICLTCKKNWMRDNNNFKSLIKNERNGDSNGVDDSGGNEEEISLKEEDSNGNSKSSKVVKNSNLNKFGEMKFSLFSKPKIEIFTQNDFVGYKRAMKDYFEILEKYKDYFDNMFILKINKE